MSTNNINLNAQFPKSPEIVAILSNYLDDFGFNINELTVVDTRRLLKQILQDVDSNQLDPYYFTNICGKLHLILRNNISFKQHNILNFLLEAEDAEYESKEDQTKAIQSLKQLIEKYQI